MNINARPAQHIDALLRDDLELKSQIATLEYKRTAIKEELKAIGEDALDRWLHQEYAEEFALNARRDAKRRQRRATAAQREEEVAAVRARLSPAVLMALRNRLNGSGA